METDSRVQLENELDHLTEDTVENWMERCFESCDPRYDSDWLNGMFELALMQFPDSFEVRTACSRAAVLDAQRLANQGEAKEAIRKLESLLEADPYCTEAFELLEELTLAMSGAGLKKPSPEELAAMAVPVVVEPVPAPPVEPVVEVEPDGPDNSLELLLGDDDLFGDVDLGVDLELPEDEIVLLEAESLEAEPLEEELQFPVASADAEQEVLQAPIAPVLESAAVLEAPEMEAIDPEITEQMKTQALVASEIELGAETSASLTPEPVPSPIVDPVAEIVVVPVAPVSLDVVAPVVSAEVPVSLGSAAIGADSLASAEPEDDWDEPFRYPRRAPQSHASRAYLDSVLGLLMQMEANGRPDAALRLLIDHREDLALELDWEGLVERTVRNSCQRLVSGGEGASALQLARWAAKHLPGSGEISELVDNLAEEFSGSNAKVLPKVVADSVFDIGVASVPAGSHSAFWERLKSAPTDVNLLVEIRNHFLGASKPDQEGFLHLFRTAAVEFPEHHGHVTNLGWAYLQAGPPALALIHTQRALRLESGERAHQLLVEIYGRLEQPQLQEAAKARLLELFPNSTVGSGVG